MIKDKQVNEIIDLISEIIIMYINDNKQGKNEYNKEKSKVHNF